MVPWKDEFEVIYCACGCGGELLRWNSKNGNERKYIRYHHSKNLRKEMKFRNLEPVFCACGCGETIIEYDKGNVQRKYKPGHGRRGKDFLPVKKEDRFETSYCMCGCGADILKYTKKGKLRRFIVGHNRKSSYPNFGETKLCECGCGEEIQRFDKKGREKKFKNGHQIENAVSKWRGKKLTEEQKIHLSIVQTGIKKDSKNRTKEQAEEIKLCECGCGEEIFKYKGCGVERKYINGHQPMNGESNPFYGKKHTIETREKLSISHIGLMVGDKNWNWKGGISKDPYCDIWQNKIFKDEIKERDNFQCQNPNCWNKSEKICIHHVDYNKQNCHPDNLITLCYSCNARANHNRDYWQDLYNKIIQNKKERKENIYAVGY